MRWWMLTILAAALLPGPPSGAGERSPGGRTFYKKVYKSPSLVYLKGFHPASQKGPTCNVYSAWMIMRYYRYHITPGQIKKDAKDGEYKTSAYIEDRLSREDFCFLSYIPKQGTDFADVVKTCIDNGIPLQWGVNLKYAPKARVSRIFRQRDAGHARVIWGYERDRHTGQPKEIIFADSWGSKKLRQKVDIDEACHMTMSMHPIFPKDTDPEVVAKLLALPGMRQGKVLEAAGKPDGAPAPKRPGKKPKTRK